MNREIKIILVKFTLITIGIIAYSLIAMFYISPMIVQQVYGQSAFDNTNPYGVDPNQQFNQYQQQPYMDPYQSQYNQFPQQYGTPYAMQQPYYGQQPYPQPQNPIQFGTSEIIYTLLGGGAIGYARYNQTKRNQDKELLRDAYAELLKEKQKSLEQSRVQYQMNPTEANKINDAPMVKLESLQKDVEQFSEKVAKV